MPDTKYAQDFVSKMKHLFNVEITITNDKGIIIASSHIDQLGDFYETAYKMIQQHLNEFTAYDVLDQPVSYNILLRNESVPYGVISVNGAEEGNKKISALLRYFFESVHTDSQDSLFKASAPQKDLFRNLFVETPINYTKVILSFNQAHRNPYVLRMPILIHLINTDDTCNVYHRLKAQRDEYPQDLLFKINGYDILLFAETTYEDSFMPLIAEITNALQSPAETPVPYQLVYTVPTDSIDNYVLSFSQLMWMKELSPFIDKKIFSIVDALDLLLISSNSWDNYNNIFSYYQKKLAAYDSTDDFLQLAEALIKHNMNYTQAAQAMFVHKNTVIFRMNKIKSILEINPHANTDHLALFTYLYYFIRIDNHTLLSFQKIYNKYHS